MRRYALRITAAAVFILAVSAGFFSGDLDAMSWPSESAILIRNFGSNNMGRPVLGMVFSGDTEVLAAERGEIIFSRGANDASRLPSPLGAWTAIDHGDGLISIYSRYADSRTTDSRADDPASEAVPFPLTQVEKQQPIASSGISGWSAQNGFYFIVYDRRERRWINPAMIVTPLRETRPVQILSVELRNAQGAMVQSRSLNQGRYTILVNAASPPAVSPPAMRGNPLAPQRIVCSVNGAEAGSLNFEAVSARDGILMVYRNGLVPARQVYENYPAFEAAEVFLNRGQANLEIIVQDAAGVSRSYSNRLFVN
jgi:hypothetical protein